MCLLFVLVMLLLGKLVLVLGSVRIWNDRVRSVEYCLVECSLPQRVYTIIQHMRMKPCGALCSCPILFPVLLLLLLLLLELLVLGKLCVGVRIC